MSPELTIVVPTFNERLNLRELLRRLDERLVGIVWECVVVDDDSPDGTADLAREISRQDPRVRCLQRIGRRGLSSACIEGMLSSAAPFLAVIDADLQHDEALLPRMLELLRHGDTDLVVASRYLDGREVPGWDARRLRLSRLATRLARRALGAELTDPMSGFFMLRREAFAAAVRRLSGIGFKILVDLLASSPRPLRVVELPYDFRERHAGQSKLDGRALHDFALLLVDKLVGRWVPARFVLFAAIGGLGVFVHLAVLALVFGSLRLSFLAGQTVATLAAMVFNYALNNELTYRDRRLRGLAWLRGALSFALACSVGTLANVGIANQLYREDVPWLWSALAGIAVGAVWNYAVTAVYTWKSRDVG
jgi:dolichol-phosphate mannosyltransferase